MTGPVIRAARAEDSLLVREIEFEAQEQFRTVGLDVVADDEPHSVEVLSEYAEIGQSWVAVVGEDLVGYVFVDLVDGEPYVHQISVRPRYQGGGIGRMLMGRAVRWARDTGARSLSLTTFDHVPWNRPLYEHLGFSVIPDDQLGSGLRRILDEDATQGLSNRVAMRLTLGGQP